MLPGRRTNHGHTARLRIPGESVGCDPHNLCAWRRILIQRKQPICAEIHGHLSTLVERPSDACIEKSVQSPASKLCPIRGILLGWLRTALRNDDVMETLTAAATPQHVVSAGS